MSSWCLSLCLVLLVIVCPGCVAVRKRMKTLLTMVSEIQQVLTTDLTAINRNARNIDTVLQKVREVDAKLTTLQGVSRLIEVKNGHYLAFRITPGIGSSAYDKYLAVKDSDDTDYLVFENVPEGCKTTDGRRFCDRHYRSKLLDLWDKLPIGQVRVGLYQNNVERRYFEFDGKGSNYLNWFSQDRLINSSYTDLTTEKPVTNFFSIQGDPDLSRRFFINENSGNCSVDAGWLVVSDGVVPSCPWEDRNMTDSNPTILFKDADTVSRWGTQKLLELQTPL